KLQTPDAGGSLESLAQKHSPLSHGKRPRLTVRDYSGIDCPSTKAYPRWVPCFRGLATENGSIRPGPGQHGNKQRLDLCRVPPFRPLLPSAKLTGGQVVTVPPWTRGRVSWNSLVLPRVRLAMTPTELETYRQQLFALGKRLEGDVAELTNEALRKAGGEADGNLSNTPLHLADLGSDYFEQEMSMSLLENDEHQLEEVAAALTRIEQGTFGRCEE